MIHHYCLVFFEKGFLLVIMAANGGGDCSRVGPPFDLPEEIQSVLPTDPYDQLDLARKITSKAIASRVTKLETEADRLQQQLIHRDRTILVLEDKVSLLENANKEIQLRLKFTLEENMKLLKERDTLAFTAEKLSQHLAKLFSKLGNIFPQHEMKLPDLVLLELQMYTLVMLPQKDTQPQARLREPLAQVLLQLRDQLLVLCGTHQANNHQAQTLPL